jgi:hypothetical protein
MHCEVSIPGIYLLESATLLVVVDPDKYSFSCLTNATTP